MICAVFASNTTVCSDLYASLGDEINRVGMFPSEICDEKLPKESVDAKCRPPPPQPRFQVFSSADREGALADQFSSEEVLIHIRNCKAAVGLEIQQSEPAQWTCDASEVEEYALLAAKMVLPTPSQRKDMSA